MITCTQIAERFKMVLILICLIHFFLGEGNEQQPPINPRFEKISSDWFSWTPPCFPVLSLEFQYVDFVKLGFMRQSKLQEKDNGKIQYSKRAKGLCEDIYYNLIIMRNVGS